MDILTRLATFPEPDIFKTILVSLCDCELKKLMKVNSVVCGAVKTFLKTQSQKQAEYLQRWNRVKDHKVTITKEKLNLILNDNPKKPDRVKVVGIDNQFAYLTIHDFIGHQHGPLLVFDYKANVIRSKVNVKCDFNYHLAVASTDKTVFVYNSNFRITAVSKKSFQIIATGPHLRGRHCDPGEVWSYVLTCPKPTSETVIAIWCTEPQFRGSPITEIFELHLDDDSQLNVVGKWNMQKLLNFRLNLCNDIYYFWVVGNRRSPTFYPWSFEEKKWLQPMRVKEDVEVALRLFLRKEIRLATWPFFNRGSMRGFGNQAFLNDRFILNFNEDERFEFNMIDLDSLKRKSKRKPNQPWLANLLTWKQFKSYFRLRNDQTRKEMAKIEKFLERSSERNSSFSPNGFTHLEAEVVDNDDVIVIKKIQI